MNKHKLKRLAFLLLLFLGAKAHSQNTLYFLENMPQQQQFNPAIMPTGKFFIELPTIGGVMANAYNSGFDYNDLDYFIDHVGNANYNADEFVNSIGETDEFYGDLSANILSFGFGLNKKSYLSFNYALKMSMYMNASSDIAYLFVDEDDLSPDKYPLEVDDINITTSVYSSLGITYTRKINDNLTIGITPCLNFGLAGLKTNNLAYTSIREDSGYGYYDYDYTIDGEAFIGLPTEINPQAIKNGELDTDEDILPDNWDDNYSVFQNATFSINLGGIYELNKWKFSASVLNLGNTKWKQNGYKLKGEEIINEYNEEEIVIKVSDEEVKIGIPTRLYFAASREIAQKWNCGLLIHSDFYDGTTSTSATASLNGKITNNFTTSVSYTAGYDYNNIGIGARIRFLPGTDFFFVTDNLIQCFSAKKATRASFALGINLLFGVENRSNKLSSI